MVGRADGEPKALLDSVVLGAADVSSVTSVTSEKISENGGTSDGKATDDAMSVVAAVAGGAAVIVRVAGSGDMESVTEPVADSEEPELGLDDSDSVGARDEEDVSVIAVMVLVALGLDDSELGLEAVPEPLAEELEVAAAVTDSIVELVVSVDKVRLALVLDVEAALEVLDASETLEVPGVPGAPVVLEALGVFEPSGVLVEPARLVPSTGYVSRLVDVELPKGVKVSEGETFDDAEAGSVADDEISEKPDSELVVFGEVATVLAREVDEAVMELPSLVPVVVEGEARLDIVGVSDADADGLEALGEGTVEPPAP